MSRTTIATEAFTAGHLRRTVQRHVLIALLDVVVAPMKQMLAAVAEQRRVSRATAELSVLSDRTLRDIGIGRHDIERVARYGRDATDVRA